MKFRNSKFEFAICLAAILVVLLAVGPAWATSTVFDGVDDVVNITSFAGIQTAVRSVGCWVNRAGDGESAAPAVMGKFSTNGWQWTDVESTLEYRLGAGFSTGNGNFDIDKPADNQWHHIAWAYDHSLTTNVPTAWIDGSTVTVQVNTTPSGTANVGAFSLSLGNITGTGATTTFNGRLASCFYYNKILTILEVQQVMEFGPQTVQDGLVCYWPLGTFLGISVAGSGGASCNGTETGTPTRDESGPPVNAAQGGWAWR